MNKWGIEIGITKAANPAQVRTEWVKWLKSGEFQQCIGKLCILEPIKGTYSGMARNATFCCLGVLCEIGVELGILKVTEQFEADKQVLFYTDRNDSNRGSKTSLPEIMQQFVGMKEDGQFLPNDNESPNNTRSLTVLNDTNRWTFEAIADTIETRTFQSP